MAASFSLLAGWSRVSSVPAGSLANASLVGAKTVYGPGPDRVSASPAAFTADTRVEKSGLPAAISTMVFAAGAVVSEVACSMVVDGLTVLLEDEPQAPRATALIAISAVRMRT